jgi:radical SAM protein with 4Fe4S-binding SPASM domain
MKYLLDEKTALRSWRIIPCAYYTRNEVYAKSLKREEYKLLLLCDGKTELTDSPLLRNLEKRGFCHPAEDGSHLTEWQKPLVCSNRYFPRMFWTITERCSDHCLHCYNAADCGPMTAEFAWDECRNLIRQAAGCGINEIKLTGGEPFLHPCFQDILREIYRSGMFVDRIYSGGGALTESALHEMKQTGCSPIMKISFDGIGTHDWLHGREGSEKDALRGIRLCIENGLPAVPVINVHRKNLPVLADTISMLNQMGVSGIQILRTTESPRWNRSAAGLSLSPEEFYEGMIALTKTVMDRGIKTPLEIWKFGIVDSEKLRKKTSEEKNPKSPDSGQAEKTRDTFPRCSTNRGMVGVAADGELYPCLTMYGLLKNKNISFGNVKKQDLKDLLTDGPYFNEAAFSIRQMKESNAECAACPSFEMCQGGCSAMSLAMTGDLHGVDPMSCTYFLKGYRERIDQLLHSFAES